MDDSILDDAVARLLARVRQIKEGPFLDDVFPKALNLDVEAERLACSLDCVSCGTAVTKNSAFCDERCQQFAKGIRYVRKVLAENRLTPDVRDGIAAKLPFLLSESGYPEQKRRLSATQRSAIFARDKNVCQLCGSIATQIDHIAGSSDASKNLRAVCGPCNIAEMVRNLQIISAIEQPEEFIRIEMRHEELAMRIAAPYPSRICDDNERWQSLERKIRSSRRKKDIRIEARLDTEMEDDEEDGFEDVDGYLRDAMLKDD